MKAADYQKLAMRTNDKMCYTRLIFSELGVEIDKAQVLNACLGLSGEVGEVNDLIKKAIYHEKEFDREHLIKELGDVCWYLAQMCDAIGTDLSEVMDKNVEKLIKRFPDGFDVDNANNRKKGDV